MMKNRVELHLHSYYSLMDGLNSPEEYVKLAKQFDMPALSLTDHGTLSGHRDFQKACREHDIKPILGVEAYISPTDRFDRRPVKSREDNTQLYNHCIILAKNQNGLENLNRLSREAWESGYYHKPRVDFQLLEEWAGDLIVLSGCLNGLIAKALDRNDYLDAHAFAHRFKRIFGDDFYMEVQGHNPLHINEGLLQIADQLGIAPVATTDCHFTRPELRWVEEAMLILSTSPKQDREKNYANTSHIEDIFERYNALYPERPISFEEIDVYMMNREELTEAFERQDITREDIYENTLAIAEQVTEYDFVENLNLLPRISDDPDKTLRDAVFLGLEKRGLAGVDDYDGVYKERAKHELEIIEGKDFSTYFLIVQDIVRWCQERGILVGPGRGSAAGSLVCYALGITQMDPIKENLLFSRFVDPERDDYPDIDMDFPKSRRGEVKEYIREKYGHVASISNFIYFKDKGVVRDAARVFGVPIGDVNKALKTIDTWDEFTDSHATEEFRQKYPEVLELANNLRGRIRSVGMHAAGVVTSSQPIEEIAPIETRKDPNDKVSGRLPVVAWDMNQCANAGFIKLDILGLNTLDVIQDVMDMIGMTQEEIYSLPLDDPRVYEELSAGYTVGVFQADAKPYRSLLVDMGVKNFDELAASNALVRPGARNTIGDSYIKRKNGLESVHHLHPITEKILSDTYGLPVYQEDVMRITQELGGFTGGEANRLRKIIGKKEDVSKFKPYQDKFLDNASEYIDYQDAESLWHTFEEHAKYSFNKSHAVAYSLLSYVTAWLKINYPKEFMTALLRNEGDKDKRVEVLIEMRRMGMNLLLPNINESAKGVEIQGDAIRLGLTDIKYISHKVFKKLDKHRPFASYQELLEKADEKGSGISTRTIGALNAVGAARHIGGKPGDDENFYEYLGIPKFKSTLDPVIEGHVSDIEDFNEEDVFILKGFVKGIKRGKTGAGKSWTRVEMLDETGTCGVFHGETTEIEPGNMYVFLVAANRIMKFIQIDDFNSDNEDPFVQALYHGVDVEPGKVVILAVERRFTKRKQMMCTIVMMNEDGEMRRALVFPSIFAKSSNLFKEGKHVRVNLKRLDDGGLMVSKVEV